MKKEKDKKKMLSKKFNKATLLRNKQENMIKNKSDQMKLRRKKSGGSSFMSQCMVMWSPMDLHWEVKMSWAR